MKRFYKVLISATLAFLPGVLFAESPEAASGMDSMAWMVLVAALFGVLVLFILLYVWYAISVMQHAMKKARGLTEYEKAFEQQSFWDRLFQLSPISRERDIMIEHDFDGIHELDNPTPPWFMFLFYITVIFGGVYMVYYHIAQDGNTMVKEYTAEVALAEKAREEYIAKVAGSLNEDNAKVVTDAKSLDEGKKHYVTFCAACHGANGEGLVGPNLTDEYWIHGGGMKNIFHTITEGVPEKGMLSWKKQLNPLQVQAVASYIISLQGSKPANGKAPQGEIWSDAPATAVEKTAATTDSSAAKSDSGSVSQ